MSAVHDLSSLPIAWWWTGSDVAMVARNQQKQLLQKAAVSIMCQADHFHWVVNHVSETNMALSGLEC